ncbi:MAG: hypothetical protein Q4A55_07100 [Aerococcus sp.]|nr:hypothetical protein [Aerococcus sp.]
MLETLAGFGAILLACYQFYAVRRNYVYVKEHGNKSTSPFIMMSLWSGLLFGIALLIVSIPLIFRMY